MNPFPVLFGRAPVVALTGGGVAVHRIGVEVECVRETGCGQRSFDRVAVVGGGGRIVVAPAEVHLGGRPLESEVG